MISKRLHINVGVFGLGVLYLWWISLRFSDLVYKIEPFDRFLLSASSTCWCGGQLWLLLCMFQGRSNVSVALRGALLVCLALCGYIDFLLVRALGFHLFDVSMFLFAGGIEKAPLVIDASGVSNGTLIFCICLSAVAVVLGGFFSLRGEPRFRWMTIDLNSWRALSLGLIVLSAGLYGYWQTGQSMGSELRSAMIRVMPLNPVFLDASTSSRTLRMDLRRLPELEEVRLDTSKINERIGDNRPPIFLIIIESLRNDAISHRTAPNIETFLREGITGGTSIAAANATHVSFFSIISAREPIYYQAFRDPAYRVGAVPLRILKKLGYRIKIFSGGRLDYCEVDRMLFGEGDELVDELIDRRTLKTPSRADGDRKITDKVVKEIENGELEHPSAYVLFYESTHHHYAWSADYSPRHTPYAQTWGLLKPDISQEELDEIRNRYLNAVGYVDSLCGRIFDSLRAAGLYSESVVALTGDHGEEFLDHGNLLHASALNSVQTHVPIGYKIPKNIRQSIHGEELEVLSHVDMFPTILDCLGANCTGRRLYDGVSVLKYQRRWAMSAHGPGGNSPSDYYLDNGEIRLTFATIANTIEHGLQQTVILDGFDLSPGAAGIAEHEPNSIFEVLRKVLSSGGAFDLLSGARGGPHGDSGGFLASNGNIKE